MLFLSNFKSGEQNKKQMICKDGHFLQCVLCIHTPPRFHRAHFKHIRLLECCQGLVMREKPICLMLCGGCLVAPLSHPSPQETLSSLIRNRTSCLRSQAPADNFPSSSCICNAGVIWLNLPYLTFLISMLGALYCHSAYGKPISSHLT